MVDLNTTLPLQKRVRERYSLFWKSLELYKILTSFLDNYIQYNNINGRFKKDV